MPINTNLYAAPDGVAVSLASDTDFTGTREIRAVGAGVVKVDYANGRTGVDIPIGAYGSACANVVKIYSTANGTTCTGVMVQF